MSDPVLTTHTDQFVDIVRRLICLKPGFKTVLPGDDAAASMAALNVNGPLATELSISDFGLLYNVGVILSRRQEPVTMGELSQALDVPLSTATRIVGWMVKNDFAERLSDPDDRRVVRVALTAKAQAMYQAGNEMIRRSAELLLSDFTSAEREILLVLLKKLVTILETQTSAASLPS